jgi:hypothetical protein
MAASSATYLPGCWPIVTNLETEVDLGHSGSTCRVGAGHQGSSKMAMLRHCGQWRFRDPIDRPCPRRHAGPPGTNTAKLYSVVQPGDPAVCWKRRVKGDVPECHDHRMHACAGGPRPAETHSRLSAATAGEVSPRCECQTTAGRRGHDAPVRNGDAAARP